jgi:hypothetical protein
VDIIAATAAIISLVFMGYSSIRCAPGTPQT